MTRGFTLVEVVVALVVLELGVLGVVGTLLLASRALTAAEALERGTLEALVVSDSLSLAAGGGAGSRPFPGGMVTWTAVPDARPREVVAIGARGDTLVSLFVPESR